MTDVMEVLKALSPAIIYYAALGLGIYAVARFWRC